ncbi:MAG TPA: HAMP domain-containing sensor histidine kinase [Verrucomicrobiae bacterium]|nr:HAMP domain-containing sensor histidine kinase [Verrucomicrobiae bacterium]
MNGDSKSVADASTSPKEENQGTLAVLNREFGALIDRQIPSELLATPESTRHAKLITRFGALGAMFGFSYASFYLLIHHYWGALIIVLCSVSVGCTPWLMRWKKSIDVAGNFLSLTLTMGFLALCFCEGGLKGHAIAWLVSVPLCALLLLGTRQATRWAVIALLAAGIVAGFDLANIELPCTYDPKWNSIVSAGGYLGLILFMCILGLIFENGRASAHAKMETAVAELAKSNEKLVHLNNEKNEFMGIAAHDLKNPLTVITFSAELLPSNNDPTQIKRIAKAIGDASSRMRDLITNLLDANAIEQGQFTSKIQCCDLNSLVTQCVENNEPSAAKKQITICTGFSEKVLAKADRAATMQILENLISNALKFSPPNTRIHVHTLPEKDYVAVTVRDEGPGISEADRAKLFQKFSRLTAQPTGGESSTGLGLSIVKRLAESMSGSIQCNSQLGEGAKFTLRLPVWSGKVEVKALFSTEPPPEAKPEKKAALPKIERDNIKNLLPRDSMRN